jgi:hypothetical protein
VTLPTTQDEPFEAVDTCDVCLGEGRKTIQFALHRAVRRASSSGTFASSSTFGSILLCEKCWRRIGRPRMRQRRRSTEAWR